MDITLTVRQSAFLWGARETGHFVIGINLEGKKDLLGMWLTDNEGSKFWLSIVTNFKIEE